jgi:hypothetical protein
MGRGVLMPLDEFDRFLSEHEPDDGEDSQTLLPVHVSIVASAVDSLFKVAMGNSNHIVMSLTRTQAGGSFVWTATVNGTTVVVDTFEEFVSAVSRLA